MAKTRLKVMILGIPNVGKSTLFNCLSRTRKAIVANQAGVTIDCHSIVVDQYEKGEVELFDSGGLDFSQSNRFNAEIRQSVTALLNDMDLVLFLVDGCREPSQDEWKILEWLRPQFSSDKVWLLVNKVDRKDFYLHGYASFALPKTIAIAAEHKIGFNDLWDALEVELENKTQKEQASPVKEKEAPFRCCLIGRPNTGKSTLFNQLVGGERQIVSPIPGTTRDPNSLQDQKLGFDICDTGGLRRPGRIERGVEGVAKIKLLEALKKSQIALLVLDAEEGISDLDASLLSMAIEEGKATLLVINKMDTHKGDIDKQRHLERSMDLKLSGFEWCPRVYISAKEGRGMRALREKVRDLAVRNSYKVKTGELNRVFDSYIKDYSSVLKLGGRAAKFYYLTQIGTRPPYFVLFANCEKKDLRGSQLRFIENILRKEFKLEGIPIRLSIRNSHKDREKRA